VHWTAGNEGDVQRGHWSFGLGSLPRGFYPNANTSQVPLWNVSFVELDQNSDFINAVKVVTRRQDTPAASYFATIFGYDSFVVSASAVAYIGFAGTLTPWDVDLPIAICKQSILNEDDEYTCTVGRMIPTPEQTGGWTGLEQEEDGTCPTGGTNSVEVRNLVETGCNDDGANPEMLLFGGGITYNEGQIQIAFDRLIDCWLLPSHAGDPPTRPWPVTLPVVDCSQGGPTCRPLVGAVEINIIWIFRQGPKYNEPLHSQNDDIIPWAMEAPDGSGVFNWSSSNPNAQERWDDFATHFNLQDAGGLLTWARLASQNVQKTIFFLPDCTYHEPAGITGGENYGILAEVPVLVK